MCSNLRPTPFSSLLSSLPFVLVLWGFPASCPALGINSSSTQLQGPSFLCFCRVPQSLIRVSCRSSGFLKSQLRGGAALAIYRDGASSSHRAGPAHRVRQPGVGGSHLCLPSPISCVIRVLRGSLTWPGLSLKQQGQSKKLLPVLGWGKQCGSGPPHLSLGQERSLLGGETP